MFVVTCLQALLLLQPRVLCVLQVCLPEYSWHSVGQCVGFIGGPHCVRVLRHCGVRSSSGEGYLQCKSGQLLICIDLLRRMHKI